MIVGKRERENSGVGEAGVGKLGGGVGHVRGERGRTGREIRRGGEGSWWGCFTGRVWVRGGTGVAGGGGSWEDKFPRAFGVKVDS